LSGENKKQLMVPHGCSWLFGVKRTASVMYKVDQLYDKASERELGLTTLHKHRLAK
jgi:dTDP-4-dehydrorhamnose 3,5-epimerase-like enzyme